MSDNPDRQLNWETIDQLDVEVSNTGEHDAEISLLPDSFGESFHEQTVGPGETISASLLPFDGEPPAGSTLVVRAVIGPARSEIIFTNEVVEFAELPCNAIRVDAVVDDETMTATTSCT